MKPVKTVKGVPNYEVSMTAFTQKLHRDLAPTSLWGYNGKYPGATFEVQRGEQIKVKWINNLPAPHFLPIDPTLNWANPGNLGIEGPIPTVPHLHGAFTPPEFDGLPENWFTPGLKFTGPNFVTDTYIYDNDQEATSLWIHDHAMGITRLGVFAGMALYYLIRDANENSLNLPASTYDTNGNFVSGYEIPLVIQDRLFNADGSLLYPITTTPGTHPIWIPEFFGDTAVVNGTVFPFLDVEPRKYRFRMLNGSNARFYNLWFEAAKNSVIPHVQIGNDGGLLNSPVTNSKLLIAPGERADVIFDFKNFAGKTLTLMNNAKAPYPGGRGGDIPQIMQFRVGRKVAVPDNTIPTVLRSPITPISPTPSAPIRWLPLEEVPDPVTGEPLEALIDGKHLADGFIDAGHPGQSIIAGNTELWEIINLTGDAHPIHVHLVQFQIKNRQKLDAGAYLAAKGPVGNSAIDPTPYLIGSVIPPGANENLARKDTVISLPGEVTRILAAFNVPPGVKLPVKYVVHCHILEHEDNEMMRYYEIV
jgi:spore coat protein A